MRRKTAPLVAVAAAAAAVNGLQHSISRKKASPPSPLPKSPVVLAAAAQKKDFPTAAPDEVEQGNDADLITDATTHDEAARYEATPHAPPPKKHAKEQAKLASGGYRPKPEAPIPFIDATCAEICSSDCATEGLGSEIENFGGSITWSITHSMPHAVEDGFGQVGDYFKDIVESIVPFANFHQLFGGKKSNEKDANAKSEDKAKKSSSTSKENINKDTTKKPSLIQNNKDNACLASCQAQLDKCADNIDSSDSIPESVEEYTVAPQTSHCQDIAKLRFIAESGNIKWSMRFGQSPTFAQVAGLAEPYDVISQADLKVLAHCAEGGNFAGLNLGAAIGLASCMVNEVHDYADGIMKGYVKAHTNDWHNDVPDATMSPAGVDPVVSDENGEFHMGEEVFYINDVRCFSGCAGLKVQGLLDGCEKDRHCASDFVDLMWRTGTLYAPTTMGNAVNEMGYQHATDPATMPRSLLQDDPSLKPGEELPGTTDPAAAARAAKKDHEHPPPPPQPLMPMDDPTSPLARMVKSMQKATPPFCKMQMCAPYPSMWIHGELLEKMYKDGTLDKCENPVPVPDVHPNPLYDGAMPDPTPPAEFLATGKKPIHPLLIARSKAMQRRRASWAFSALQMSGKTGN